MTDEQNTVDENKEPQTLQIGETIYDVASLTERGVNIINDIRKVEAQIGHHQINVSIAQLAKAKLLEELNTEAVNFTKIGTAEVQQSVTDVE